jgi:hypothetical protein
VRIRDAVILGIAKRAGCGVVLPHADVFVEAAVAVHTATRASAFVRVEVFGLVHEDRHAVTSSVRVAKAMQ